ncbi:MAG: HAD hydrolase family protein [Phycisphaeraceae bacterium]|nr:HAD hydrolase family protein [Phycisphaeraceae bacterium]
MTVDASRPSHRFDAILCDNDGCLVSESTSPFDLASLHAVRTHNERAASLGGLPLLTICSGRPQPFVEAMCRLLAIYGVPAIAENGVWIYDAQTNRYEIDPSITREHLAAVEDLRSWLLATFGPGGLECVAGGVSLQPGKAASVSVYHPNAAYVRDLLVRLRSDLAGRYAGSGSDPMFRVSMTELYINCDLSHISKGTAIDRMATLKGMSKDRLAGIGDMPSDMAIRDRVAWFACPANAVPELKHVADYVSSHAEARGVVDILGRISMASPNE